MTTQATLQTIGTADYHIDRAELAEAWLPMADLVDTVIAEASIEDSDRVMAAWAAISFEHHDELIALDELLELMCSILYVPPTPLKVRSTLRGSEVIKHAEANGATAITGNVLAKVENSDMGGNWEPTECSSCGGHTGCARCYGWGWFLARTDARRAYQDDHDLHLDRELATIRESPVPVAEQPLKEQLVAERVEEGRRHTPKDQEEMTDTILFAASGDTIVCANSALMALGKRAHARLRILARWEAATEADGKVLHFEYSPGYGEDEPDPFDGIALDKCHGAGIRSEKVSGGRDA